VSWGVAREGRARGIARALPACPVCLLSPGGIARGPSLPCPRSHIHARSMQARPHTRLSHHSGVLRRAGCCTAGLPQMCPAVLKSRPPRRWGTPRHTPHAPLCSRFRPCTAASPLSVPLFYGGRNGARQPRRAPGSAAPASTAGPDAALVRPQGLERRQRGEHGGGERLCGCCGRPLRLCSAHAPSRCGCARAPQPSVNSIIHNDFGTIMSCFAAAFSRARLIGQFSLKQSLLTDYF